MSWFLVQLFKLVDRDYLDAERRRAWQATTTGGCSLAPFTLSFSQWDRHPFLYSLTKAWVYLS